MSFILDALRKSEHERQRQLGPSIAELPVARPAPRVPPWVWVALAALLTLNIAVVAWFLARQAPAPGPQPVATAPAGTIPAAVPPLPAPTTAPATTAPVATAASPVPPQAEATPAMARVPPAEPPPQPVEAASVPAMREVRPLAEEAAAETVPGAPAFAAPEAPDPALLPAPPLRPAAVSAGVPTIDQLPPQATAGLPPLDISLHIYATQPSQRAVFINGTRYREGEGLPGGAVVQEITPDGAVISYGGQRFLLPRQ